MTFVSRQTSGPPPDFPLGGLPDDAVVAFFVGSDIPGDVNDPFVTWPVHRGNDGQGPIVPVVGGVIDESTGFRGVAFDGVTEDANLSLIDGPYTGLYAVTVVLHILVFPPTEVSAGVVHSIGPSGSVTDDKVLMAAETRAGGTWTIGPGSGNEAGHSRELGSVAEATTYVVTQVRRPDTTRRFLQNATFDLARGPIAAGHNNMWSFRFASRENDERHLSLVLLAHLCVDLDVAGATEQQAVDAHLELAEHFGVVP